MQGKCLEAITVLPNFCAISPGNETLPDFSADMISRPLDIGGVRIRNRSFLAPMSGVTDVPFRQLAWRSGAGLVVSEMVASQAFVEGEAEMHLKQQAGDIPLHVVQLAGREACWMSRAAEIAEANGARIIDINMGCPARRVTTGYSGSALMRDLDHALSLVDAVVQAVKVPVTLKMRLGWDHQSINAPELASRAENAGVQMVTVHGRTRCQFYKGKADWDAVKAVRSAIKVPLVVNGDIRNKSDASQALLASGADAVMIGRGAYGAPWLPGAIAGEGIEPEFPNGDFVKQHHEAMLSFYGLQPGIRQARKHLGWYLEQLPGNNSDVEKKRRMMTSFEVKEIHSLIDEIFEAGHVCRPSLRNVA